MTLGTRTSIRLHIVNIKTKRSWFIQIFLLLIILIIIECQIYIITKISIVIITDVLLIVINELLWIEVILDRVCLEIKVITIIIYAMLIIWIISIIIRCIWRCFSKWIIKHSFVTLIFILCCIFLLWKCEGIRA